MELFIKIITVLVFITAFLFVAGLALEALNFFNAVVHDFIVILCGKDWPLLVL